MEGSTGLSMYFRVKNISSIYLFVHSFFYIPTTVSPPSSPLLSVYPIYSPHPLFLLVCYERGRPTKGVNKALHINLRQDQALLPASRLDRTTSMGIGSRGSEAAPGIGPDPIARGPANRPGYTLTHMRGPRSVTCRLPSSRSRSRVLELPPAQVCCLCEWPWPKWLEPSLLSLFNRNPGAQSSSWLWRWSRVLETGAQTCNAMLY